MLTGWLLFMAGVALGVVGTVLATARVARLPRVTVEVRIRLCDEDLP